jgi:molecular chaperone DnaK
MPRTTIDFGIDLGTTNSSIAVMQTTSVQVLRNADGADVTPSVVRIAADGALLVGRRAKQVLELDPDNARAEFKRLMGTTEELLFPKSGRKMTPEALSAEVLKSLRADARDQTGEDVRAAVVTVPALFEIPQCEATARAATLAGLERAPLLQEPIAAAIACGFREGDAAKGYWLVYDLGGGTFDTSLLRTKDGRMQVVDHDGDNFLGGKDFDWLLAMHAATRIREERGLTDFSRASTAPAVRRAFAKLKAAAEDAKIALSRSTSASIQIDELMDGLDVNITIGRDEYEALIAPRIERTLEIVRGLLSRAKLDASALEKLIFVGGPTLTPALRAAVEGTLGLRAEPGVDPMTIVAQGAAIHAATIRFEPADAGTAAAPASARKLKLEYPPISQDAEPFLVGRIPAAEGDAPAAAFVEVIARDGSFVSGRLVVNERGGFSVALRLHKRGATTFDLKAYDALGNHIEVTPREITLTYGMVVSEPPLSRSIGIATADNECRTFVVKGASLPARRTFTLKTVESLRPGDEGALLRVPVVQGESTRADRNRHIGTLEISAKELRRTLPPQSEVEITIDVDGSATVRAQAFIALADQLFEQVITMATPKADPEALAQSLWAERSRLVRARKSAGELGAAKAVSLSRACDDALGECEQDIEAARGGDTDAAQQAARRLLDLAAQLDAIEALLKWPEIDRDLEQALARARAAVIRGGQDLERAHLDQLEKEIQKAREKEDQKTIEWKTHDLHSLAWAVESRDPEVWIIEFAYLASTPSRFMNPAEAHRLIEAGRAAHAVGHIEELKGSVRSLWRLLPPDEQDRARAFGSGVR